MAASPATQKAAARGLRRPDEVFSRDGPLGVKADVRVETSDGQKLWLHRVVLELWSGLFRDLLLAHDELGPAITSSKSAPFLTIKLTDTAADLMLLLSCFYPASYCEDRKQGSTLSAQSLLPLLGLADKYHCPHIIDRCAAFAIDHVIQRLAAESCTSAAAATDYLQLTAPNNVATVAAATTTVRGVVEWVVHCLELAVRLDLNDLVESTSKLLGRRFFDWHLQDAAHANSMAQMARVLPAELFVHVLQAIPMSTAPLSEATSSGHKTITVRGHEGGLERAGGGPRIVPVMVAAAGPAAVALQQQDGLEGAAAVAPPPPIAVPVAGPQLAHHPQPFGAAPAGWQPPLLQFLLGGAVNVAAGNGDPGPVPFAAAGEQFGVVVAGQPVLPEPLLGPAQHRGW